MAVRWRTRDGRRLRPSEMSDQHILNTIAWLQRRKAERAAELNAGWTCLGFLQGEYATYYAEQDLGREEERAWLMDAVADEWIKLFLRELAGRALV